jgi:hypothetical protein
MRTFLLVLFTAMFGLLFVQPAFGLPHGTSIGYVNVKTNRIGLVLWRPEQGVKVTHMYNVSPGTTITVNGTPAKLSRLHKGERVVGYTFGDEDVLISLDVQN